MIASTMVLPGCAGTAAEPVLYPVQGRLEADILPNPVVAVSAGDRSWRFPFEVVLRESGGVDIEIEAIRIRVSVAGVPLTSQLWDAQEIRRRGYRTSVPAGGLLQYAFAPVRTISNPLLIEAARGEVEIEIVDLRGNRSSTIVPITVTVEGA